MEFRERVHYGDRIGSEPSGLRIHAASRRPSAEALDGGRSLPHTAVVVADVAKCGASCSARERAVFPNRSVRIKRDVPKESLAVPPRTTTCRASSGFRGWCGNGYPNAARGGFVRDTGTLVLSFSLQSRRSYMRQKTQCSLQNELFAGKHAHASNTATQCFFFCFYAQCERPVIKESNTFQTVSAECRLYDALAMGPQLKVVRGEVKRHVMFKRL